MMVVMMRTVLERLNSKTKVAINLEGLQTAWPLRLRH